MLLGSQASASSALMLLIPLALMRSSVLAADASVDTPKYRYRRAPPHMPEPAPARYDDILVHATDTSYSSPSTTDSAPIVAVTPLGTGHMPAVVPDLGSSIDAQAGASRATNAAHENLAGMGVITIIAAFLAAMVAGVV
eukprot:jgi/Hompol1/1237/HPOL_004877-RA